MNYDLKREALRYALRWSHDRTKVGTHPGSDQILQVANEFEEYLTGRATKSKTGKDV